MKNTPKEMTAAIHDGLTSRSLGHMLAATVATEERKAIDPITLAEQKRQAEIQILNKKGEKFFFDAKNYFTDKITARVPTKELFVQVGSASTNDVDNHYPEIWFEIDWYNDERYGRMPFKGGPVPQSMLDPERFGAAWEDFKMWASANNLEPYWEVPNPQWRYLLRVKSLVTYTDE